MIKKKEKSNELKYMEIANHIMRDIFVGKYKPGDQIPTERDLSTMFGVAHLTLRQALSVLVKKGLIVKKRSKGVFVADEASINQAFLPQQNQLANRISVIGLYSGKHGRINPVNWPIRLKIYQGIVEAAFFLNIPIQVYDLISQYTCDKLVEECKHSQGVIINEDSIDSDWFKNMKKHGIPMMGINLYESRPGCSNVEVDLEQGGYLAGKHLIELGHRRIGFIGGLQITSPMKSRFDGFHKALEEFGADIDSSLFMFNTGGFPEDAEEATEKLLDCSNPPTAIFTASDYRAIGVIQKLKQMGISVPEDISVIGFDNIPEAAQQEPALTTINNPHQQLGFEAVKRLYRHIQDPSLKPANKKLPMSLVVRKSTGKA